MRRSIISLLAGIVMAALALFLVGHYKDGGGGASHAGKMIRVVVAARDLAFGRKVLREDLQYAEWPEQSVPKGAFTDMNVLLSDKEGKGNRVTLSAVDKGEPLRQQQISGFGDKSTLSRKIGEDKRAFSLRVNDVSGVAGFLLPGDHVDVMFTRSTEGGSGNLVTDILLQNVTILGVDQLSDEGSKKPTLARTVTMEVTPDQAQKLALAQQAGTLSLTLRNYANNAEITSGRVSISDLVGKIHGKAPVSSDDNAGGGAIRIRRGISVDYATAP